MWFGAWGGEHDGTYERSQGGSGRGTRDDMMGDSSPEGRRQEEVANPARREADVCGAPAVRRWP
jgi:hypothetical protein